VTVRGRPLDPRVTDAIKAAALGLLVEQGFARMSMEAIAREAGVGKPALYRRFPDKAALVVDAIATELPVMHVPPPGPAYERLRGLFTEGLPMDAPTYLGLIGGLMAERGRHPELIAAFRSRLLGPRRDIVAGVIADAQAAGEVRGDLPAVRLLDMMAGQILARTFAGLDVGRAWRAAAFDDWWRVVRAGGR
jgi:AcrR family transcriptional regulator